MPEIIVTEFMDEAAIASLAADYEVLYDPRLHAEPRLGEIAGEARALIVRNQTKVREPLLAACPRLEAVGRLGVGLDNIDVDACARRNIAVLPATGANDLAVAEYVLAGLLMLLRGSYFATPAVAGGGWPRNALIGREIAGKTLGLIGFGGIARKVAARAASLGMKVLAYDPMFPLDSIVWREYPATYADLPRLLAEADAVSLHVPLTEATRGLLGAAEIAAMKPGAVLINSARGGILDETALAAALAEGRLSGAMLDVYEKEPLPKENPFHGVPNLILTPHIAGVTEESNARVSALTAENIRRALEGRR